MRSTDRLYICGVGFDRCTEDGAAEIIIEKILSHRTDLNKCYEDCETHMDKPELSSRKSSPHGDVSPSHPFTVYTPNPLIVMKALEDRNYMQVLNRASLSLADGTGIVKKAAKLRTPLSGRCTGIGTAEKVISGLARESESIFILGGLPGRAEEACNMLCRKYPGLTVAGFRDGYFAESEIPGILNEISEKNPGLLCVCLGAGKQENFTDAHLNELRCGAVMCIGGAVDVWAGKVRRAPSFFRRLGLEWLWRMIMEPRRFRDMGKLIRFVFICR